LEQTGEHPFHFRRLPRELGVVGHVQKRQVSGQQQMVLQLAGRSHGDRAKTGELSIAVPAAALGQICRNRR
jgi:hypothetical protein